MNDTTTDETEKKTGPFGGERLRAARRENDISVADIAKELHLDEPKVRALERNEFEILGAPVFAKGHLRKYADLVGVSVDDVMTDYYMMNRAAGAPPVVGPARKRTPEIALGPWITAAFVLVVVVAAAFWWFAGEPEAPQSQIQPATLAPFSSDRAPAPIVADESGQVTTGPTPESAVTSTPAVEPPVAQSVPIVNVPPADPASTAPQVQMILTFSGDCWTEVSDASGRRLYYDLGQAGTVVDLSGDEPLRVILGDSANVSITVDGRDYPISASARSGRLARLDVRSQ